MTTMPLPFDGTPGQNSAPLGRAGRPGIDGASTKTPGGVTPGTRGPWGVPGSAACLESRGEGTVRGALSAVPPVPALRRPRVSAAAWLMVIAVAGLALMAAGALAEGIALAVVR